MDALLPTLALGTARVAEEEEEEAEDAEEEPANDAVEAEPAVSALLLAERGVAVGGRGDFSLSPGSRWLSDSRGVTPAVVFPRGRTRGDTAAGEGSAGKGGARDVEEEEEEEKEEEAAAGAGAPPSAVVFRRAGSFPGVRGLGEGEGAGPGANWELRLLLEF